MNKKQLKAYQNRRRVQFANGDDAAKRRAYKELLRAAYGDKPDKSRGSGADKD